MKLFKVMCLSLVSLVALFTSCAPAESLGIIKQASVAISDVELLTSTSVGVTFIPDATCEKYDYAIGQASDRAAFLSGKLSGIKTATESIDALFENLDKNGRYTIYAKAYDADGVAGPLASIDVRCNNAECTATVQYVGTESVGFSFVCNNSVYRVDYAFGEPGNIEEFDSGDMSDIKNFTELKSKVINFFDIEKNTEYTLYYKFYDRSGNTSESFELPITTGDETTMPYVDLTLGEIDTYEGNYTFTPNDLCSKYLFLVGADDAYSEVYNGVGFAGDIYRMMLNWAVYEDEGWGVYSSTKTHPFRLATPDLLSTTDMEFFVLAYDNDDEPCSLQRFEFTTPAYEPTGETAVEISEIEIKTYSASFTIDPNEHTFAVLYQTFTKDTYDTHWSDPANFDDFKSLYMSAFATGKGEIWHKGDAPFTYTEDNTLDSATEYCVVVIPLNGAGVDVDGGWGEPVVHYFTTKAM